MKKYLKITFLFVLIGLIFVLINSIKYFYNEDSNLVKIKGSDYIYSDGKNIYCKFGDINNPIPKVGYKYDKQKLNIKDPSTLEIIDYQFIKDIYNTYEYETICTDGMPGSCLCNINELKFDTDSFKILDGSFVSDKNGLYRYGEKINIDNINDIEVLNYDYIKNMNNVYYCDFNGCNIIDGADSKTFKILDKNIAKDINNFYEDGVTIKSILELKKLKEKYN